MSAIPDAQPEAMSKRGQWMALTAAVLGWMFDGLEMGIFPLVARPALGEMLGADGHDRIGHWMSINIAIFLVGASFGGLFFGWLGDRIGRVRAMVWSVLVYSIFSALGAFSIAPWHLAGLRFVASLGMGGEWALGVALVMEIWPSRSRPLLAGMIGAAANVGFLLVALLSLGLATVIDSLGSVLRASLPSSWAEALLANQAWRLLMLLCAFPALLTFFIRIFVPESERWRVAASRSARVRVTDIFVPGIARLTLLGVALSAVALIGTWGSVQWIPSWGDKLTEKAPRTREMLQIFSASGACIGTVAMAFLAERLNRRVSYFCLCVLSLLFCQFLFGATSDYGWQLVLGTGVVGILTASFYGWFPLYLPELFPTRIRATGQGFAYNAGRLLAAAGTLVSGQLLDFFKEDYARMCQVITWIYLAGMVLIWFCPETKGRPLPD